MSEPDRVIFLASLGASSLAGPEQMEAVRLCLEACAPLPFTWSAHDSWAARCGRQEWLMLGLDLDWGGSRVSTLTIDASFVRCAGTFAVARFLTGVAAAWNAEDGATFRSFEEVTTPGEWPPSRMGWFQYFGPDRLARWPDALWSDQSLYMVVRSQGGGIGLCVAPEPFADQHTVEARAAQAAEVLGLSIRPHRRELRWPEGQR